MTERKRVFGQNEIYSLDTYLESVTRGRDGLVVKVAGPNYYDNEMHLEFYEEPDLLKAFDIHGSGREPVKKLEDISGHSITAFYQEAKVIGFSQR